MTRRRFVRLWTRDTWTVAPEPDVVSYILTDTVLPDFTIRPGTIQVIYGVRYLSRRVVLGVMGE
jgi:hypothetical protein